MRQHLVKCFLQKEIQPFLLTQTAPHHQNYFPFIEIKLICSCQMPETYGDMLRRVKDWVQLFCACCLNYPWGGHYRTINRKAVVFM